MPEVSLGAVALVLSFASVVAEAQPPQQSIGLAVLVAVDHILKRPTVTGQIRGRVFDEYGASISDASVSFQPVDPSSGLTPFAAVADARGRFDFVGVRPGIYRVTGKAAGFEISVSIHEVLAGMDTEVTVVVRRRIVNVEPAGQDHASGFGIRRASARHASCPQSQRNSVRSFASSQWALQYFPNSPFSGTRQTQLS